MKYFNTIRNNQQSNLCILFVLFGIYILLGIWEKSFLQENILVILAIVYVCVLLQKKENKKCDIDLSCFAFLIFWYNTGLIISSRVNEQYNLFNIIYTIVMIIISEIFLICNLKQANILYFFKKNWAILLIIVLFAFFSIETIDAWAMWDARVYYAFPYKSVDIQRVVESFDSGFSKFFDLYIAGHASVGYSLWLLLFQMFNQSYEMVQVADIILACISIYAYFCIVKSFIHFPHKNIISAVATLPYAFSPFILGVVGNINVDSITTYYFVIFVACSIYEMQYMEIIAAAALCFTKETAIIYYFAYIIGKILFEYKNKNNVGLRRLVQVSFGNFKNYIYAIPVIAWAVLYYLNPNGGWSNGEDSGILWNSQGMHCFGLNKTLIISKMKQIFFLNFNWIFWCAIILTLIVMLYKKRQKMYGEIKVWFPLCLMGISVIAFGILYITPTNARYIIPIIPVIYLLVAILLSTNKRILCIYSIGISIMLLVECFWSVDPVMKVAFPSISTGGTIIYSMDMYDKGYFSDSIVYNRQYQYWGEALERALQDAGYDGEMLIVLPGEWNLTRYCLFGDHETLWNKETNQFEYYNEHLPLTEQQSKIQIGHLSQTDEWEYENDKELYIIPAWGEIDTNFLLGKTIDKQATIRWKGYVIQYYLLSV